VPRGAFSWVTRKLKGAVSIPLVTTNRINDPQVADDILARGDADMVSMARPFLADAELLSKAQTAARMRSTPASAATRPVWIRSSSAKSPPAWSTRAPATKPKCRSCLQRAKTPGGGRRRPAGLAFAVNAAARGHRVTLFDAQPEIGGQFNIAKQIPGKEEFYETLRYYRRMIDLTASICG
jgi:2,4-dienoyl-CoA reductase (NADPH2)